MPKKSSVTPTDRVDPPSAAARSGSKRANKGGSDNEKGGEKGGPVQGKDTDMGSALRSVYQRTVSEAIPDEMIDLLGKLD